jgi:hypothetical protein
MQLNLVSPLNDHACPCSANQILVVLWTCCDQISIALKWWESVVTISLNSNFSIKSNLNINWPLPSYCIISSTSFCLPQWVLSLWLLFIISARNFGATWEVGKKSEDTTYYGVPLLSCLNLVRLWLLLEIIAWEARVVGERSQGEWATRLIQCLIAFPRFFSRPFIQALSRRIFKGERVWN